MSGYEITDEGKRLLEYLLAKERGEDIYDAELEDVISTMKELIQQREKG